jgi:hypothetical protein
MHDAAMSASPMAVLKFGLALLFKPICHVMMHALNSGGMFLSDLTLLGTYATFLASYLVFALGKFPGMKIDRPGMAIIGAVLMFAFGVRGSAAKQSHDNKHEETEETWLPKYHGPQPLHCC